MHDIRYRFGSFELDVRGRALRLEGVDVRLNGKPFELLLVLVRKAGGVVTRQEAIAALWPDTKVHENSLAVAVSMLRQVLARVAPGMTVIETLPRRGYRLAVDVQEVRSPSGLSPVVVNAKGIVGREPELERLRALALMTQSGHGTAAWISGEPGIGKTALVERLRRELAAGSSAPIVATGKCVELSAGPESFAPIIDAVAELLDGPFKNVTAQTLVTHCPRWCLYHPAYFAGNGVVEAAARETATMELPTLMRQFCDALCALANRTPVVLILEDLHWVDSATVDLLRVLFTRLSRHRLFVVGTYRAATAAFTPERLQTLVYGSDGQPGHHLHLAPLAVHDVLALIERERPGSALNEEVARLIWQKSEGLPLFVVRLLRAALDGGALAEIDHAQVARAVIERVLSEAPASVTGFIRQQLLRLPQSDRALLDAASVCGDEFRSAIVADALDMPEDVVERQLTLIESTHQLVNRLRDEDLYRGRATARFRFCHALVQVEIYSLVTAQNRLALHRRVADALSALTAERSRHTRTDEGYDHRVQAELAFHLERAGDVTGALLALLRAGDYCDRRCAKDEAVAYYERGRALLARISGPERTVFRLLIAQNMGWATFGLGQLDKARAEFRAAGVCARELEARQGDPETRSALESAFRYLDIEWEDPMLGRPTAMVPDETAIDVSVLRADAYFGECAALACNERYPEILQVAGELLRLARATANRGREAEALAWLGHSRMELGELDMARNILESCLSLAPAAKHSRGLQMASYSRAVLHALQGELDLATDYLEAVRHSAPMASTVGHCLSSIGDISARRGNISAALTSHSEALELRRGALGARAASLAGWIYRELGAFTDALHFDLRALETCLPDEAKIRRALSYSLAATQARLGDLQSARQTLDDIDVPNTVRSSPIELEREWLARCEIHIAAEEYNELSALAREWLESARAHHAPEGALRALHFLVQGALAVGDLDTAAREMASALELYQRHSYPLIGVRLFRSSELLETQRGNKSAAEWAKRMAEELFAKIADTIDDPGLRFGFKESVFSTRPRSHSSVQLRRPIPGTKEGSG